MKIAKIYLVVICLLAFLYFRSGAEKICCADADIQSRI